MAFAFRQRQTRRKPLRANKLKTPGSGTAVPFMANCGKVLSLPNRKKPEEGLAHTTEALRLDPNDGFAHYDLGRALVKEKKLDLAAAHFAAAVQLTPTNFNLLYNSAEMHCSLGEVLLAKARPNEAAAVLARAVDLDAKNGRAHYYLALAQAAQGMGPLISPERGRRRKPSSGPGRRSNSPKPAVTPTWRE